MQLVVSMSYLESAEELRDGPDPLFAVGGLLLAMVGL